MPGRGELRTCRFELVLCLVDGDRSLAQRLGGFVEVTLGLGDLLLDPSPVGHELVGRGLGPKQGERECRRHSDGYANPCGA